MEDFERAHFDEVEVLLEVVVAGEALASAAPLVLLPLFHERINALLDLIIAPDGEVGQLVHNLT